MFAAGGGAAAAAAFDDDEREKGKKAAEEKEQEDAQRYKMAFDRIMKIVGVTADTSSNLVSLMLVNVYVVTRLLIISFSGQDRGRFREG